MDICLEDFKTTASNVKAKLKKVLDELIKKLKAAVKKVMEFLKFGKKPNKEAEHKDIDKTVDQVQRQGTSGLSAEQLYNAKYRAIGPHYKKSHWEEACKSCKISSFVEATDASTVDISDMQAIYNAGMNIINFLKNDIKVVTTKNATELVKCIKVTVAKVTGIFEAKTDTISIYDYFKINTGLEKFNTEIMAYGWEDCECWDSKGFTAEAPKVTVLTQEINKLTLTDPTVELSNEDGEMVIQAIGDISTALLTCLKIISVYVKSYHTAIDTLNAYLVRGFRKYVNSPEAEAMLKSKGFDDRDGSVAESLFIPIK